MSDNSDNSNFSDNSGNSDSSDSTDYDYTLLFTKLNEDGMPPARCTDGSAGFDIRSSMSNNIQPNGGRAIFDTGIAIQLPYGKFGKIASRSGLAFQKGIVAFDGTIDEDYRGELKILLFNFGTETFKVRKGERICQLIIQPYENPDVYEVDSLSSTARGINGFGSTGSE